MAPSDAIFNEIVKLADSAQVWMKPAHGGAVEEMYRLTRADEHTDQE
jgi:hypothetical protein